MNRKGRVKGGMVMGIRKDMLDGRIRIETGREGMLKGRVRVGREEWEVMGEYVNGNIERILNELEGWVEDKKGGVKRMMVGDFNARTGTEGGGIDMEGEACGEGKRVRLSKDGKINGEGRRLVEFIEEREWGIFNGCTRGAGEGKCTFTGGRGNTVIDYGIGVEEVRDGMESFRVRDRVESDHQPLEIRLKGKGRGGKEKEEQSGDGKGCGMRMEGEISGRGLGK